MGDTVIGLLHPGEMGAAVAGCLTARGFQVLLGARPGAAPATAGRAAGAGLPPPLVGRGTGRAGRLHPVHLPAARGAGRGPLGGRLPRRLSRHLRGRERHLPGHRRSGPRGRRAGRGQLRGRRDHRAAARRAGRAHPAVPVRPAGRRGPGPVHRHRPGCPRHRHRPGQRGRLRGENGLCRVDQGHRRADPRGARAGPGRRGGRHPARPSGRCPSRTWPAGQPPPPGRRRPRAGAGPGR